MTKKILNYTASDMANVYQKVNVSVAILSYVKFGRIKHNNPNALFKIWFLKKNQNSGYYKFSKIHSEVKG